MPLKLALVLHNHQPVGNLPWVFAGAYEQAYAPMLALLERHPRLRFVCHYTGPLLQWLESERPEVLDMLARLALEGRAEVLGGGLYEPILAAIPDADKVGQVEAMTAYLRRRLGVTPRGCWLAERVWEPHLPPFLQRAGIDYTILDEEHFAKAGLAGERLDGYWTTEDGGQVLRLFPASTELRYLIPWRDVDEVMRFLRRQHDAGRSLLVFADDGEKFGSWPGTYRHVYDNGWMDRFLSAVAASGDWLETTTLSEYAAAEPARGRAYIPSASYHEMEEWSLPPATQRALLEARQQVEASGLAEAAGFMRLGHWRNFLAKYDEANVMQQRATAISAKVHALPPGRRRDEALDHLWQGQCNCPYWHGVFGGVYMYHVRHANFAHLIAAEAIADPPPAGTVTLAHADFDADGQAEVRLRGPEQSVFIDAGDAAVYEWDLVAPRLNLLNTLADYREAHSPADQVGTSAVPPRPRRAFSERLVLGAPGVEQWEGDRVPEWPAGRLGPWTAVATEEGEVAAVAFHRVLAVINDTACRPMLEKRLGVDCHRGLAVRYTLNGALASGDDLCLAVEVCLAPPPGSHTVGSLACGGEKRGLLEAWQQQAAAGFIVASGTEPGLRVTGVCSPPATITTHPLLSSHRTENGEERVYQGTRLVLSWPLSELAGRPEGVSIGLSWDAGPLD